MNDLRVNSGQQSSCCSLPYWKNMFRCSSREDKIRKVSTIIGIFGLAMAAAGGILAIRNKNEVQLILGAVLGALGLLITCVAFVYSSALLMLTGCDPQKEYTSIS